MEKQLNEISAAFNASPDLQSAIVNMDFKCCECIVNTEGEVVQTARTFAF
ncbi:MAG: hypothetical protein ACLUDU_04905 [Butyricimonas faecihominis]